jgi:hypothetical protein
MPFVTRNAEGKVESVHANPTDTALEELPHGHPDLLDFLGISARAIIDADPWIKADLSLARVTEDLLTILMERGVISFTDLPIGAQEKLIARQGLRSSQLSYVQSLFGSSEDNLL